MKITILSIIASALAVNAIYAAPQPRDFGLKVKAEGKSTSAGNAVTQVRNLELTLSLAGKEPAPDLVVKWTIYGHSRQGHDLAVIKNGEIKTGLEGGKSVTLTTSQATIKGVREHFTTTGRGRSRRSKKVPATGQEYAGNSVVVMNGGTVVAEYYSRPSLKGK